MTTRTTFLTLALLASLSSTSFSQSTEKIENKTNWFLSGGIGVGSKTIALNAGLYVLPYKKLAVATKFNINSEVHLWGRPDASESGYSLLVGFTTNKKEPRLIFLAGYSRVNIVETIETADQDGSFFVTKEKMTNGIGFNVQAMLSKADHIGLSLNGFGNINPIQSYAGLTLSLNIGLLRD